MRRILCLVVVLGGSSSATAAPPDVTYFYPAGARRGTAVEVTAAGTFERWPVGAWASSRGVEIKPGKRRGQLTVTVAPNTPPGVCWVRLHDEQGASSLRPFLIGTLPEVLDREPNDAPTNPQVLPGSNVTVNGRLEKPGDVDVFALELQKGQTLVASVEANHTLKSPMDGVLQVLSAEGFVLEQNDDYRGLDPQIVFTAPRAGRYLVRIFAFPATPDASIRFAGAETFIYRLTLCTGGFADHAWPLAVDRAAPGAVEVVGWNVPKSARSLPVVARPGSDLVSLFHPELANVVSVRLEPHPAIAETEPNDRRRPQRVELPVTISGRIGRPGEVDVYEFTLKKGQTVQVALEARSLDSPLDPVLRVTDRSGKVVSQPTQPKRQLTADPELTVTATSDSTYRVEISDLHDHSGPRHVYRLRLALPRPDFALTVGADRFALLPGKPLDLPVTITRRGGFKGEVEVTAEGLPAGITAQPVSAAAGSSLVTLRLTGEGTLAAGAFHIVGRIKGEPEQVRIARAPTEIAGVSEHLWVTLSKTATAPKSAPKKKKR